MRAIMEFSGMPCSNALTRTSLTVMMPVGFPLWTMRMASLSNLVMVATTSWTVVVLFTTFTSLDMMSLTRILLAIRFFLLLAMRECVVVYLFFVIYPKPDSAPPSLMDKYVLADCISNNRCNNRRHRPIVLIYAKLITSSTVFAVK